MSVNYYSSATNSLIPLGGVPTELINSKADKNDNLVPSSTKETTTTATKAHTEGDYFDLNGTFVKALDDISIGDTLVEGINIETTDVGSELSSKANTSSIPTKVSDLQNDSGFVNHDTTYESKTASSGGSDVSLVTTGEKYTWNNKADSSSVTTLTSKLTVVDPDEGSGLITFGVDADGNYGYKKVGADTVTPFLSGGNITYEPYSQATAAYGSVNVLDPGLDSSNNLTLNHQFESQYNYYICFANRYLTVNDTVSTTDGEIDVLNIARILIIKFTPNTNKNSITLKINSTSAYPPKFSLPIIFKY